MYELNPWAPPCGQVSQGHSGRLGVIWTLCGDLGLERSVFSCDQLCAGPLNEGDKMSARTAAATIGCTPPRHNPRPLRLMKKSRSRVTAVSENPVRAAAAKRASCGPGIFTLAPSLLPHCQTEYISFWL